MDMDKALQQVCDKMEFHDGEEVVGVFIIALVKAPCDCGAPIPHFKKGVMARGLIDPAQNDDYEELVAAAAVGIEMTESAIPGAFMGEIK